MYHVLLCTRMLLSPVVEYSFAALLVPRNKYYTQTILA